MPCLHYNVTAKNKGFFSHNELTEKAQAIPKMLSKIKAVFILELFLQSKKGYH